MQLFLDNLLVSVLPTFIAACIIFFFIPKKWVPTATKFGIAAGVLLVLVMLSPNTQPKSNFSQPENAAKYAPENLAPMQKVEEITPSTQTDDVETRMKKEYNRQKTEMGNPKAKAVGGAPK